MKVQVGYLVGSGAVYRRSSIVVCLLVLLSGLAAPAVGQAAAPHPFPWTSNVVQLTATCTSGCAGAYQHTYTIHAYNPKTGNFSGTGYADANHAYTEQFHAHISASGSLVWTSVYTGVDHGYTLSLKATRQRNSTFTGTMTSSMRQRFKTVIAGPPKHASH